jgi:[ribosomal protein S5]-alanine N-acetyltransferase
MPSTTETGRLLIRDISDDDLHFVYEGLSHPEVIKYYGVSYKTAEETKSQLAWYKDIEANNTGKWWLINVRESASPAGAIGFNYHQPQHKRIEIGFWLLPSFQGKGFMHEAVENVIPLAVAKWNVHRIEAMVEPENSASARLLIQCGFIREGLLRDYELKDERYISLEVYSRLV